MKFSTTHALVTGKASVGAELKRMAKVDRNDDRYCVHLCDDGDMLKQVQKAVAEKKKLKPEMIIVVGIGGSNLGTLAIQEAVLGKMYNAHGTPKIYYADTVCADKLFDLKRVMEQTLKKKKNIMLVGISKSGGTTETIANFEFLLSVLKKHKKDYQKHVMIITGENSKFWNVATQEGFSTLPIPTKVGGRFSVFSAVGLFPLGMIGIDIVALLKGAKAMRKSCLLPNGPAAKSAAVLFAHAKKGVNIHNTFVFCPDLEGLGLWYRQLLGESVGKGCSLKHKKCLGLTPLVSVGSTDLHSIGQLFLGGPYDKIHTFVNVDPHQRINVPKMKGYETLVDDLQGKSIETVLDAIYKGTQKAYRNGKRPYMEIILEEKSAYEMGAFIQMKMMEMIILGHLMGVDPFGQPAVEQYKIETKKLLKKM